MHCTAVKNRLYTPRNLCQFNAPYSRDKQAVHLTNCAINEAAVQQEKHTGRTLLGFSANKLINAVFTSLLTEISSAIKLENRGLLKQTRPPLLQLFSSPENEKVNNPFASLMLFVYPK